MQATTIFIRPLKRIPLLFNDSYDVFPEFLQKYIIQHHIQAVVCFGDTRPYHLLAKRIATKTKPVSGHLKKAISAPTTSH